MTANNTKLVDINPTPHAMPIEMPTAVTTRSSTQGHLELLFPHIVTKAYIVSAFKRTLISISQVVDVKYAAYFDVIAVYIINTQTNKIEWKGKCNHITKLWDLPLQKGKTATSYHTPSKQDFRQSITHQLHQH